MWTANNFPAYIYTHCDERSKEFLTHTHANFKATKSFRLVHTHTELNAAKRNHAHAKK